MIMLYVLHLDWIFLDLGFVYLFLFFLQNMIQCYMQMSNIA